MADEKQPAKRREPTSHPGSAPPRPRDKHPVIPLPQRRRGSRPELPRDGAGRGGWFKRSVVGFVWLVVLILAAGAALRLFLHDAWIPLIWWNSFTLYVATMYGKRGIRCNAIAPGVIRTPALDQNVPREALEVFEANTLVPRLGTPEDVAGLVVWLASDESSFVTGQVLRIDGGTMSHHPVWAQLAGKR